MTNEETKAQKLMFEMIKEASFNSFDGPTVVRELRKNRDLWRGVWMGRTGHAPLITLRDLEDDYINIDEMYILSTGKDDTKLMKLMYDLSADEVDFIEKDIASSLLGSYPAPGRVLRAWWD